MPVPESTPTAAPMAGSPTAPGAPRPALKPEKAISYADEDEELLFGPTARPNDSMRFAGRQAPRRPQNLERFLPAIAEIARQPDAPEQARAFARVLAYHLGKDDS